MMDSAIEKAEERIEYLSSDEEAMRLYFERERSLHERANMINTAEERGRIMALNKVAINLLRILDDESISKNTGLTIEEIKLLRENNR